MKFCSTATASVSFSVLSLSLMNSVFAQNTANNEILVYPPKKPPTTKKWYLPLEFGEGRFTTGRYSGLNRFQRRRVDADKLDPFADRQLPKRKRKSSSFKPGTWNWRPGKKPPAFSYKYKIINLTKDSQGSYEGMPGDYRQNYRPIPHVRFGGTFAPIPSLMGDPTQHRQGWYIKKYRATLPKKEQYNQYIMDIVNDDIHESYPSLEWVTYSWKNPHKWKYNLSEEKVRPRFGSYEAFSNYDSRFPAYEPKRRYEVLKVPLVPPIYKRSAEKEDKLEKAAKSIDITSVPSKSEDVIRNLQSASSIMESALRTAKLRQNPESEISSSDYDSNEALYSENSISLSSVYLSSENNSSSTENKLINSEDLRNEDITKEKKVDTKPQNSAGKKRSLFNANRKQQYINENMRHVRQRRSPRKESIEKLAKKLMPSRYMPDQTEEVSPVLSIFRLEDQPDSFWDSIYGRPKRKKRDSSSSSYSDSDSGEATIKPVITTMQTAPKAHPGIVLPQDKKRPFLQLKGKSGINGAQKKKIEVHPHERVAPAQKLKGVNEEPLMEARGKRDRARREKKKKKLTSEERADRTEKRKRKGRTNYARDYSIEIPREGADLKSLDAFKFPTFPPHFTTRFVPPWPYKQPTPYVQPTIRPRPPPQRPYVRVASAQQGQVNNAQYAENMFHLQYKDHSSLHKVEDSIQAGIIKDNVGHVQSDMFHVQNKPQNGYIAGSRVDHTKHRASVIKDNADRIQSDIHNIKNDIHINEKISHFANIPHIHNNKGLHRSLGLPAVHRRNLERELRLGDDRLYDSEEISENDKAEWSIGPPLNESEPILSTEERTYVPEGAYQFPHFRNPNFDPDTAYDENGVPIFMSPNYTQPTTLKGDGIFGLGRGMQHGQGLIGQHHNQIAHDFKSIAGGKSMKISTNIEKNIQDSRVKLSSADGVNKLGQVLHEQMDKDVHPGVMNQGENLRKHVVIKRHASYWDYHDDHPYSKRRMGLSMPRRSDVHYLRQGVTVPPYQPGMRTRSTLGTAVFDYESRIIFKRSVNDSKLDGLSVLNISGIDDDIGNATIARTDISGIDDDIGNATTARTRRSKRNAKPEPKRKKEMKFKKYQKQLTKKDDDKKNNLPQENLDMLNSITEKLKEQLVTDMNHGKVNSDKQKSNIPNSYSKKDDDEEVDNVSKAVPPIHLVKQITEEIYNNLDKRYPLNKPVLNSRVTVVHARPGEEEQFLPIQHAGTQVRLNKKTGEYQICYVDKNAVNSGVNSVRFVNGSVHEDKEQRKKLWQQFDEKLRNIRAGLSPTVMVTTSSTPVTTAPSSGERRTRKKRRRVVKIVRVRRRKTTTPEPVSSSDDVEQSKASEETSDISDKSKQVSAASESKTSEKSEISDIKETKQKVKKKKKIVSKRRKVGRKSNVTEKPVIAITEVHKEKKKLEKIIETVPNITQIHETYSAVALKSSEENKNTYFTSEKIIHIASSSLSPAQINISTSEIPVTTTLGIPFIVTTKPTLVAITGLPQSEEYRNMTTKSFKRIIRNMTSFSTYLYSKYDTVGTKQTTARSKIPTTLTTAQPSRTTPVESSSEFLISSSESTESSIFAATTESLEIPEITEPSVSSEIVESTKELDTRRSTLSSQSAEDLAARTTTELIRSSEEQSASKLQTDSFKSSEERLKSTTMRKSLETLKDFTTLPQVTSTEESHKSLETLLSVSAVKSVEDNATCIASTSNIITADVKTFITKMLSSTYSEYGTEKPTEEVTDLADDVSKHITEFTTFPTTAASTSASTVGPTISEVTAESPTKTILSTTEIIEHPTETSTEIQSATEHTTSVWWPLPTVVFKTYDTLRSTTYTKKGTIQPSVYGEGWPKGGRYKYQPYSSRSLGSRYKPNLPVTYKSYWDKQRHRHGRYGRPRKFVAPKYTWQHGRWILADIPESATLMPVTTTVSAEDTGISLVETKHSTMVTKQGEKYMTTSTYKEQHTISSFIQEDELKTLPFIEEDWTTAVSIQKKEHEKFGSHEVNLTSSPIIKENHTTLLPDRQTPTTYSSDKRQKTVEPSETYTVSQTSVEIQETVVTSRDEEYITSSTSPHPMFQTHEEQTIMLPKEMHMQHVTKYITVPTTSKVKGTTLRPEHEEFTTVHSLPVDRNTVQPPFAKKYTTFSDAFEIKHTTLHPIYEKHSPEFSLPPMWKPEIDKEHYSTEPPPTVDTHIAWTPYYEISATILSEHKHRTSPPVAPFTVKDVHAMSETLPHLPAVTKEVPSYKGPKFEWPVFDIKNIFTTVSPLLKSFPETTLRHQIHEDIHITDTVVSENQTPKVEITTSKHIDEESLSPIEESYVTEKSFITESIIFTEKPDVIDRSTTSSADITTVGLDTLAITPTTEDEYSLLKVIPDTDLISSEEGVVKKIFVNPFKAVKKFFKDSSESVPVSQEQHYINYDKPNDTASYDFNDIYDEPYFDKNATKQYFTKLRLNGTYVTLRTIYRRPSNFTFPPVLTEKPATQPPVIATARTHKPSVTAKVGLFGFMKHRAKKTLKNIVNFFTPDLSDEEEEMRRMRKNTMNSLEKDGDDDDDGH